ncbi:MAG TPA: hypothetical protein DD435_08240, partial [Cyanobacteria bacterium UBA8530]|nr:hypothetical protein [Cyanobacteria bacterium UBA8530]
LLGAKSWEIRYPLTLALHQEAAEACYLCGQYARMEELASIAHGQALALLDEIPLYEAEIKALFVQNRMTDSIRQGLKTLARLGIRLPEDPTEEEARRQLEKTFALLEKITIEGLPDLPWMTSPENLACMRILIGIGHPANLIAPRLFVLITSVLAEFSLLHGNSPWSSLAYSAYALVLIGWDDETSYRLGKTAAQLLDPPQAQAKKATVLDILGCMILPLKEPLRNGILVLEEGLASALETGDYLGGALNALNASILSYFAGEPLETLKHRILNNLNLISHFRQPFLWNLVAIVLLAVLRLKGETDSCDKLASFDEEQFIAKAIQANFIPGIVEFFLCKLMNAYLFEEDEQLLLASAGASEFMEQFQDTFPPRVFLFYDSLAYLRLCSKEEGTAHSPFLKRARDNQETLRDLARLAPMNLQHKVDLVDAEIARVVGEEWQAA